MPEMSYMNALKLWNLGMPSWCVPRKGTVGHESIMRIRKGEPTKTPKEIVDELERKTTGKGKKARRSAKISLE